MSLLLLLIIILLLCKAGKQGSISVKTSFFFFMLSVFVNKADEALYGSILTAFSMIIAISYFK